MYDDKKNENQRVIFKTTCITYVMSEDYFQINQGALVNAGFF